MLEQRRYGALLDGLEYEKSFLARLHGGLVIRPGSPAYPQWKQDRGRYEALQPAPFTARWAQDNTKDAPFRPVTWITAAFLHADTSHLIGNMVFLFLFGFSVELALGRGLYLAFYLAGALGAALLAGWAYAGQGGYGLGASGAISALMGMLRSASSSLTTSATMEERVSRIIKAEERKPTAAAGMANSNSSSHQVLGGSV